MGPPAQRWFAVVTCLELVTLHAGSRAVPDSDRACYLTASPDGQHFAFWTRACRVFDRGLEEVYARAYWGDKGAPCGVEFSPTGDAVVVLHEADGMSRIAFFQLRKRYARELNYYVALDRELRRFAGRELLLDEHRKPINTKWDDDPSTLPVWDRMGDMRATIPAAVCDTWDPVAALQPHARGMVTLSKGNRLQWLSRDGTCRGECGIPARKRSGFMVYGRPLSVSKELALVYDRDAGWAVGAHEEDGVLWSAGELVWASLVEGGFLTMSSDGRATLLNTGGSVELVVCAPRTDHAADADLLRGRATHGLPRTREPAAGLCQLPEAEPALRTDIWSTLRGTLALIEVN